MLGVADFLDVVRLTPLVAIDLIVTDPAGRVLLGRRRNRPARDSWFVPGGRIFKDETLDDAFARIAEAELGIGGLRRADAMFYGLYEHRYDENFAGRAGVSTHYVVLAHCVAVEWTDGVGRAEQHSEYAWLLPGELLAHVGVHENTKAYFRSGVAVDRL